MKARYLIESGSIEDFFSKFPHIQFSAREIRKTHPGSHAAFTAVGKSIDVDRLSMSDQAFHLGAMFDSGPVPLDVVKRDADPGLSQIVGHWTPVAAFGAGEGWVYRIELDTSHPGIWFRKSGTAPNQCGTRWDSLRYFLDRQIGDGGTFDGSVWRMALASLSELGINSPKDL